MSKIYILLSATGTLFAKTIRVYTRVPYSHVSISLDEHCDKLYSFARTYTNNPFIGSFQHEHKNEKVFGKFPNIPCELFEITVSDEQYKKIKKIINSMEGKKYNKLGLLCRLLKIPYDRKNKYFCSEFVAYTLKESGVYTFNKPLNFVDPIDFRYIPIAKKIYSGNLHDLK